MGARWMHIVRLPRIAAGRRVAVPQEASLLLPLPQPPDVVAVNDGGGSVRFMEAAGSRKGLLGKLALPGIPPLAFPMRRPSEPKVSEVRRRFTNIVAAQ